MKWYHICNIDWLKARQQCLTATDVKDLLPVTKSGRPRKITDEDRLKVFSRKLVNLTVDDCESFGPAARGHLLEPYAIDTFNGKDRKFYHWDDVIIRYGSSYHLAFSPDACDVPQTYSPGLIQVSEMNQQIKHIAEIKSYNAEKHVLCGYSNKMDLEERWQIAVAMAVCPTIEDATLIFFNPSMRNEIYSFVYTRNELQSEIDTIIKIEEDWNDFLWRLPDIDHADVIVNASGNHEEQIIEEINKSNL